MRLTRLPWVFAASALALGCSEEVPDVTPFGDDSTGTGDDDGATSMASLTTGASAGESSSSDTAEPDGTTDGGESSSGGEDDDDNGGGQLCGDGQITGTEDCDCSGGPCTVDGLGGNTCADLRNPAVEGALTGGTLQCNPASCKYDLSLCTWCGDGEINGNEGCEPKLPIAETCMSLGAGGVGDLSCDELCQIDTTGCTECGGEFNFDVANCPGGWTVGQAHNESASPTWACGDPTVGPRTAAGMWGTSLDGNYNNSESSFVASPPIDLTACADGENVEMRLYHWFDFEGSASNRDGGIVQVSSNGTNWTTVEPVSGTGYIGTIGATYSPVNGSAGFSGNDPDEGEWVQSNFDVSAFSGASNLQVRFVFGSDSSVTRAGWYIDRVEFIGSGGG